MGSDCRLQKELVGYLYEDDYVIIFNFITTTKFLIVAVWRPAFTKEAVQAGKLPSFPPIVVVKKSDDGGYLVVLHGNRRLFVAKTQLKFYDI